MSTVVVIYNFTCDAVAFFAFFAGITFRASRTGITFFAFSTSCTSIAFRASRTSCTGSTSRTTTNYAQGVFVSAVWGHCQTVTGDQFQSVIGIWFRIVFVCTFSWWATATIMAWEYKRIQVFDAVCNSVQLRAVDCIGRSWRDTTCSNVLDLTFFTFRTYRQYCAVTQTAGCACETTVSVAANSSAVSRCEVAGCRAVTQSYAVFDSRFSFCTQSQSVFGCCLSTVTQSSCIFTTIGLSTTAQCDGLLWSGLALYAQSYWVFTCCLSSRTECRSRNTVGYRTATDCYGRTLFSFSVATQCYCAVCQGLRTLADSSCYDTGCLSISTDCHSWTGIISTHNTITISTSRGTISFCFKTYSNVSSLVSNCGTTMSNRVTTQSLSCKTCCNRISTTCFRCSTCCNWASTSSRSTQTYSNVIYLTCTGFVTNSNSIITSCSRVITSSNCRRTRSIRWFTYGNSSWTRCFWLRTKSKRLTTGSLSLLTNSYIHIFARCCLSTDRNRINRLISCTKTNCNTIFFSCICVFTNSYCLISSTSCISTNSNCVMRDYIVTFVSISICISTNIDIVET